MSLAELFSYRKVKPFESLCRHKAEIDKIMIPITCCQENSIIGLEEILRGDRTFDKDHLAEKHGYCALLETNHFLKLYNDSLTVSIATKEEAFFRERSQIIASKVGITGLRGLQCREEKFMTSFEMIEASLKQEK